MKMNKSFQLVPGVTPQQVRTAEELPKPCSPTHFKQHIEDRTLKCVWETGDTVCFKCANGDQWLVARELTSSRMQYRTVGEESTFNRTASFCAPNPNIKVLGPAPSKTIKIIR